MCRLIPMTAAKPRILCVAQWSNFWACQRVQVRFDIVAKLAGQAGLMTIHQDAEQNLATAGRYNRRLLTVHGEAEDRQLTLGKPRYARGTPTIYSILRREG
jgi:hypothetical protein